ncbi:MAG: hypothetical protein ABIJ96_14300 [Elusimicrobiota bacterium]
MRRALLILGLSVLAAGPLYAANPTMEDDFTSIVGWLTAQTAQGLAFNSGSTFDPPNEMRAWRIQPDFSLGLGLMPFDKNAFPQMQVEALAEKGLKDDMPSKVLFPNLTFHSRMGLPWRMDMGIRLVNMTVPKNYRLSETMVGNGQSNTMGIGLRKHFFGRGMPLLTVSGAYNRVFGYFNFKTRFNDMELVPNVLTASSNVFGQMDWNVTSIGVNFVVSQVYGKWTPFIGAGYNRISGIVDGRMEAVWETPLIATTVGRASGRPEPHNTRLLLGFQRDGSFFSLFVNGELKTSGVHAGRSYIVSTGLAAPFRIGARSSVVRYGRNKPKGYASLPEPSRFTSSSRARRKKSRGDDRVSHRKSRLERYWNWGRNRDMRKAKAAAEQAPKKSKSAKRAKRARREPPELIFIY